MKASGIYWMTNFQKFIVASTYILLILNIYMVTFYAVFDYVFQFTDAFSTILDLDLYNIHTHYMKPLVDFLSGIGLSYLIYSLFLKVKGGVEEKGELSGYREIQEELRGGAGGRSDEI